MVVRTDLRMTFHYISLAFQGTTFMASQPNRCAGTDPYQVC